MVREHDVFNDFFCGHTNELMWRKQAKRPQRSVPAPVYTGPCGLGTGGQRCAVRGIGTQASHITRSLSHFGWKAHPPSWFTLRGRWLGLCFV